LRADLTVGCDGRWSLVRQEAGLIPREFPLNFDVWWFRLPGTGVESSLLPRSVPGKLAIVIPREGYLQVAWIGPKGTDAQLRARGIAAFRRDVLELLPEAAEGVQALASMDDVKHLDVRMNLLGRWYTDGLLCIGDAAHAMSPVGGIGINLAVQDAVATARILADPLRQHRLTDRDLAAVQRRRYRPTVLTQGVQRFLHARLVTPILAGKQGELPAPVLALLDRVPRLATISARIVAVGFRPEHAPAFARGAQH
jgi:2-polyprenyl-6-methoxyphenol hydroxylase-like FAD-dependent oxidoreductase